VEFERKKKVLRVTMDMLYDILVQVEYLPTENESGLRKSDSFCRFYELIRITSMNMKSFTKK